MERPEYEKMYELEDSYWWFVGRRRLATALLEQWMPHNPMGPILDVGCGTGGNLEFLLGRWGYGVGIDLNPLALDFARRRNLPRLAQASALALPYPNNTFGLVTTFDVLYHRWIIDDDYVVRECYRVLRPGGWLLLMDSALPSLWSRHDEIYYARQRYTLDDMHQMLCRVGFSLRKLSYINTLLFPAVVAVRLLARWFPPANKADMCPLPGWLNRTLARILGMEMVWLRRGTLPIGSSLVGLAQKPMKRGA